MTEFFIAFLGVFVATYALSPITRRIGLVDKPDHRKQHIGAIPLVGGIAMFAVTALAALFVVPQSTEMTFLLVACALLTMTGSIDDKFDLNYQIRLGVQALAGILLVWGSNTYLTSFGDIVGTGEIDLGSLGVPITILAIIGMINAYNMIDGIDGLSGALSLIAACSLFYLIGDQIADGASDILLLMMGALSAYLIMNLHLLPRWTPKIFMGDAGSMLLGFIITAFLIRYSQAEKQVMMPVTALWIVAVPLMDIVVTCLRRIRHGKSPFHPDRTHVHHIFMRAGFNARWTLILILIFQALAAGVGIFIEKQIGSSVVSFLGFVALFFIYLEFIRHSFKVAKWTRKHITHLPVEEQSEDKQ